jgi:hypothetical protein
MHTVRIDLIADQEIYLCGGVVNLHDLRSLTLNGSGEVISYNTVDNDPYLAEPGPYNGLTSGTAEELKRLDLIPIDSATAYYSSRMNQNNPAILKKYILVEYGFGEFKQNEYRIALYSPPDVKYIPSDEAITRTAVVRAIYRPTGRGPFRGENGRAAWEYEYIGVEAG